MSDALYRTQELIIMRLADIYEFCDFVFQQRTERVGHEMHILHDHCDLNA